MRAIQLEASRKGARVFRNNTGVLPRPDGTPVHFGLCPGSSDLIGWTGTGRFLAIEVKRPGSKTKKQRLQQQQDFIDAVNRAGGLAFFAEGVDDLWRLDEDSTTKA